MVAVVLTTCDKAIEITFQHLPLSFNALLSFNNNKQNIILEIILRLDKAIYLTHRISFSK